MERVAKLTWRTRPMLFECENGSSMSEVLSSKGEPSLVVQLSSGTVDTSCTEDFMFVDKI